MKLLVLLVVLIAAFTANCRDYPDGHPKPAFTIEEQDSNVYHQQNKDVKESVGIEILGKKDNTNLKKLVAKLESLDNSLTQANLKLNTELLYIREKQYNISDTSTELKVKLHTIKMDIQMLKKYQDNITDSNTELIADLKIIKDNQLNMTDSNTYLKMELQNIGDHQANITDTNQDLKDKLDSTMKNFTDSKSNLITDVASIKQSLANASVAILSKLNTASASNSQIKTYVTSMKQSFDSNNAAILSKLNSASASNSQLQTDVTSMKQSLTSNHAAILTNLNSASANTSQLKTDVNSLKQSLTNINANIISKLNSASASNSQLKTYVTSMKQSMTSNNANILSKLNSASASNSQMKTDVTSMKRSLTSNHVAILSKLNSASASNSQLKTDVSSMKQSVTSYNANILSKLNSISDKLGGCPEGKGLFYFGQSNQCFRVLQTRVKYDAGKSACSALGLRLAHPSDPVSLRNLLMTKYDLNVETWVGARGTGSYMTWEDTKTHIYSSNSLWYRGQPGSRVSSSYCLTLTTLTNNWKSYPKQPYYSGTCASWTCWTLCEFAIG